MGAPSIEAVDVAHFLPAAQDFIDSHPGRPSNDSAEEFLHLFPLPSLLRLMEDNMSEQQVVTAVVQVLVRILRTDVASQFLPSLLPLIASGLLSSSSQLRHLALLAIEAFVRLSPSPSLPSLLTSNSIQAENLWSLLEDKDADVSSAAEKAIIAMAGHVELQDFVLPPSVASGLGPQPSAQPSLRALSLAPRLASLSPAAAAAVQLTGAVQRLLDAAKRWQHDELAAVTACEILAEFSSSSHAFHVLTSSTAVNDLIDIAKSESPAPLIRSAAITSLARIAAAPHAREAQEIAPTARLIATSLLNHEDSSSLSAAIDAAATLACTSLGAAALISQEAPSPSTAAASLFHLAFEPKRGTAFQLPSVHAVANIFGAERREGDQIVLDQVTEAKLMHAALSAAASSSSGPTLASAVAALLRQTEEMRIAAYRFVSAAAARPWALSAICNSPAIIEHITSPYSESNKIAMDWRHATCVAASTAAAAAGGAVHISSEVRNKLDEAVRRGPYLARQMLEAIPIVTTDERPPMGP